MDETREAISAEEAERATEPAETGNQEPQDGQDEKTFTQAEVNEIIRRRLAKEREKFTSLMDGEGEKTLIEREKAVLRRELRADALEKLKESGIPARLADLLDYSDEDSYKISYDRVCGIVNPLIKEAAANARAEMIKGRTPHMGSNTPQGDSIREAFRPKI